MVEREEIYLLVWGATTFIKMEARHATVENAATASDLAGNTAKLTATCVVPHDQGQ
jgi:hypothetical protein